MCGICGYQGKFDPGLVQRMMKRIAHRGPDDQGFLEDPVHKVALGHVRLSIIDLRPEGRQPLKNENGSIFLVCNGEIYNYRELRAELIAKGHFFSSLTDSEVLLHLYEEDGIEMLSRLNGIFSFAIFDYSKNELFCARDQLGVKPFYYSQADNIFVFASELKAILCSPGVSKEIDPTTIHNHLTLLWSPSPASMFKSIRKLEPGFALIVKNGEIKRHWSYYEIPYSETNMISSERDAVSLVQEYLLKAVERQLVADVPVGAFLSGGLDSSAIVATVKRLRPDDRLKCYTISLAEGKKYEGFVNDLPYAQRAAHYLDVDLEEIVIEADIVNNMEKMIYLLDEPQADLAPLNIMLICQKAKEQGMKVLLSGAGGDDIFSGYRRHAALYLERFWSWLPYFIRSFMAFGSKFLPLSWPQARRIRKIFENASLEDRERLIAYFFWINNSTVKMLYTRDMCQALGDYTAFVPMNKHLKNASQIKHPINRMLYLDCKTFLPDHNLNYTDKMSMASGVEVRVPLLDIDLVKLAAGISPHLKQNAMTGKYVFRKAMEPFLPHDIIYRPKAAIPGPLRFWLLNDLKEMVHDLLSEERIKRRGWFNHVAVSKLIKNNEAAKIDASYTIWAMVSMEIWASLFLDRSYES